MLLPRKARLHASRLHPHHRQRLGHLTCHPHHLCHLRDLPSPTESVAAASFPFSSPSWLAWQPSWPSWPSWRPCARHLKSHGAVGVTITQQHDAAGVTIKLLVHKLRREGVPCPADREANKGATQSGDHTNTHTHIHTYTHIHTHIHTTQTTTQRCRGNTRTHPRGPLARQAGQWCHRPHAHGPPWASASQAVARPCLASSPSPPPRAAGCTPTCGQLAGCDPTTERTQAQSNDRHQTINGRSTTRPYPGARRVAHCQQPDSSSRHDNCPTVDNCP